MYIQGGGYSGKSIKLLSKEKEWLKEVDSCLLRCSIFNLEDAVCGRLAYEISSIVDSITKNGKHRLQRCVVSLPNNRID